MTEGKRRGHATLVDTTVTTDAPGDDIVYITLIKQINATILHTEVLESKSSSCRLLVNIENCLSK